MNVYQNHLLESNINYDDYDNNNNKNNNDKLKSANKIIDKQKLNQKVLMMDGTNVKRVFLSHHQQQQQKLPTIWTSKIWPYWQQNFQSSSTTKNIDNIIIDDKNANHHHHDEQTAGVIKLIGKCLKILLFKMCVCENCGKF